MPSTSDIQLSPTPSILLIGDGGTRKTRFLIDAVQCGFRPYVFDFDRGMSILRGIEGIDYDTFKDAPFQSKVVNEEKGIYEYGKAWPAFIEKLNNIGKKLDDGEPTYNLLMYDSLTTLSNIAMNFVLKEDGKSGKPAAIQNWGLQSALVERVMEQLTTWDVVKIATAHIQRNTNDLLDTTEMLPLLTGKLAGKIGIYFDEVYYCVTTTPSDSEKKAFPFGKPVLVTQQDKLMKQAKSRYGVKTGTETRFGAVWEQINAAAKRAA